MKSWLIPKDEIDATTRAAQEDSAYDPKRSDPIPAMSPTLSPTLSAITCKIGFTSSEIKMPVPYGHYVSGLCANQYCKPKAEIRKLTAGFLGSSSGMFLSTLPTRSAPTSAAFV